MSDRTTTHDDPNYENLPGIQEMLAGEGLNAPAPEEVAQQPIYKMVAGSKIPVSKAMGKIWSGRISAGQAARKVYEEQWDEAVEYYTADQSNHRGDSASGRSGNTRKLRKRSKEYNHTENVIFSAIKALIPAVYARNPTAEITPYDEADEATKQWVSTVERLCNTLANMRAAPGIHLKYKVKQALVASKLMNVAWVETGYTIKEDSSDQALMDLQRISDELSQTTDSKRIIELEGELVALEEKITTLSPAGPYCKFYSAKDIVVDPEAVEPDFADAKWMAVCDYYPTNYLNAVYGERDPNTGTYKSIYEPTAVLPASSAGDRATTETSNFRLFDTNAAAHYGYNDTTSYLAAQLTNCWRIYDRVTRRILLYADNRWDWPIWVEDDRLQLPAFFPFEPLIFNVAPMGPFAHSEVAYVLDQQDSINEINDAERRARFDLQYKVFFDQQLADRATVERVLTSGSAAAESVKVPEGKKLDDMFYTPQPNILRAPQLFATERQKQVIDGILGVTPSLRASEFKTNTTNQAIQQYNATTNTRLDEQLDEIEEFIGRIFYNVAFLCARFMSNDEVTTLLGMNAGQTWRQVDDPAQLRRMFTMRVVGGSTVKPTSQFKQQIAVQVGQTLGQFANAAPGSITKIVLKLFQNAYDEVGITDEDWRQLDAEIAAKLGIEAQSAQPTGAPPGAPGGNPADILGVVDQLPPEAKQALGNAMAKGVPMTEALQQIMQLVQQQASPPQ
jgi:hypothetical protein